MIIRLVKMTFEQKHVNDFLKLFSEYKERIAGFEGCTHLELLQDKNNPVVFFTYSKWEDGSFLDKYRKSDLFIRVWGQTKKLFAEKAEAWTVEEV